MKAPDRLSFPDIEERPERNRKPYRVRWFLNGREHNRSFTKRQQADRFRSELIATAAAGSSWDSASGLPAAASRDATQLHEWARSYLAARWGDLEPNTRRTEAWTLTYMVERSATPLDAAKRRLLLNWLSGEAAELPAPLVQWSRGVPALEALDRAALSRLLTAMRLGVRGKELRGRPASRQVAAMRRCLEEAERQGKVDGLSWPPMARPSRTKKSKIRATPTPHARTVLGAADAEKLLAEMTGTFRTMTAVGLYAGLRPSEIVTLEAGDIDLEARHIHVRRAWTGTGRQWGEEEEDRGLTKTATERFVPITDILLPTLSGLPKSGPLFLSGGGKAPDLANWRRSLRGAAERAEIRVITPYECRHFFISHLARRIPIADAAAIAGNSPEVLVKTYVHPVEGATTDISKLFS